MCRTIYRKIYYKTLFYCINCFKLVIVSFCKSSFFLKKVMHNDLTAYHMMTRFVCKILNFLTSHLQLVYSILVKTSIFTSSMKYGFYTIRALYWVHWWTLICNFFVCNTLIFCVKILLYIIVFFVKKYFHTLINFHLDIKKI